jgi:hypothetical protein
MRNSAPSMVRRFDPNLFFTNEFAADNATRFDPHQKQFAVLGYRAGLL